jgi:hypothetical protein
MNLIHHRRILAIGAAAVAVTASLLSGPNAAASTSQPTTHLARVTPVERADGMTGAQLLGQLWSKFYTNDGTQDLSCTRLGRTGGVLSAEGQLTCTVEEGTPVLIQFGGSCDDVVDPAVNQDFYGATAAAQRRCILTFNREFVDGMVITVDGGAPVDMRRPAFEVLTSQQRVWMPEGNFYGISARPVSFVVDTWAALVTGLGPGLHTMEIELTLGGDEPFTVVHRVRVVPCQRHDR